MQGSFDQRNTQPETVEHVVRGVGGTTAVTKVYGPGVALTYTGTGAYLLTWSENPGTFLGATHGLAATTPGDIAGHTVVFGAYDASAFTLAFVVYNASDAAHDLAALEWVTVVAKFATGAVA